jgi:5'-deoxynucleotidase YfbR-like HD superfamily hydrolase
VAKVDEMGLLKRSKRTSWLSAGVDNPESLAEHTFRTAIIGYLLARIGGDDPTRRQRCVCSTTSRRAASGTWRRSGRPMS